MDTRDAKPAAQKIDENDEASDNGLAGLNKQKRKRRSKNDAEGRSYKCIECGKSYLSMPALTNHRKTKHDFGKDGEKKGRGRPRKNPPLTITNESAEKKFETFFDKDIRRATQESIDLQFVLDTFREIFTKYSDLFKALTSDEEHSFRMAIVANWHTPAETIRAKAGINCDEIFFLYLQEIAGKTNRDYFHFLFKFAVLFRECINKLKTTENGADFTALNNAENVPDSCNEFITEFMDPNDYYGLDTTELIEAIQHFCSWLYYNQYTTSRLTLL